jgi:hypothetical protein
MPPLQDPETLARYKKALANWKVTGMWIGKIRPRIGLRPISVP